jgi:hypothetical protein
MLFEAQRNKISRAGRESLDKRKRSTASAAAHGWARRLKYPTTELRRQAAMGFQCGADESPTVPTGPWLWAAATTSPANPQGLGGGL